MFRLLFQYLGMTEPEWIDSDNVEHLQEQRDTMLQWADNNNARFTIAPFISDISKDPVQDNYRV